jgi:hypothetical protein
MSKQQKPRKSRDRNIFIEALNAKFVSISAPGFIGERQEIRARRDLVAQEVLDTYPGDTVITRDLCDTDDVFNECLECMHLHRYFEFPAREGQTVRQFQIGIPGEPVCLNTIQYSTRQANKDGVHVGYVTLQELWDATPLGESGWLLPSGYELRFYDR